MLNKKLSRIRLRHFMSRFFAKGYDEGPSNQTSALSSEYGDDFLLKDVSRRLPACLPVSLHAKVRRARCVLKVLVLLRLIYKDLLLYGTSSGLVDHCDCYKPQLSQLLVGKEIPFYQTPLQATGWRVPFRPDSAGRRFWSAMMLFLLVATIIFVPVEISFYEESLGVGVDVTMTLIDCLFLTDVAVTLNTAYWKNRKLVYSRKDIALHYLRGTLVIDTISAVPLDLFSFGIRSKALLRYMRIFRLFKVFRAARFHKAIRFLIKADAQNGRRVAAAISRILGAAVVLLLLAHLTACLWYLAALYGEGRTNWVTEAGLENQSLGLLYMFSLYWSITVLATIGYGDIAATTNVEMVLACAWMLIGAMFFSFFLSTMSSVITSLDLKGTLIRQKLSLLTIYCKDLQLSKGFLTAMAKQLHISMRHNTLDQTQKMDLAMRLSKRLRVEMGSCIYNYAARRVRFFALQDPIFLGNIVSMLEYRLYKSEEVVYQRGSYADEIYFMGDGRVSFVLGSLAVPFRTMVAGSFFGETEVLGETPREYTAVAVTLTETFVLSRTVLGIVNEDFPQVTKQLFEIAKKRKEMCLHSLIQSSQIVGQLEWKSPTKLSVDKALLNAQYMSELDKLKEVAKVHTVESKSLREGLKELAFEVIALKTSLRNAAGIWRQVLQYR